MIAACLREGRLLLRLPNSWAVFFLLVVLTTLAVGFGLRNVAAQEAAIANLRVLQAQEDEIIKAQVQGDAGAAAYYRFHATGDASTPLAFAALGQRDVAPTLLRVRALALEGQIYENEAGNPELAVLGRFDVAFVVIFLVPLFLIALLHDLWTSEREAGRLASLQALPRTTWSLWGARIVVRSLLVLAAVLLPFLAGAAWREAGWADTAAFAGLIVLLVAFWTIVAVMVAARSRHSATAAATLAACWLAVTLILPTAANLAINALTPLPSGANLVRENREAVHDGWDIDRNLTMARFYALYPAWAHSPPMTIAFDWKWYYAFQHLGDEHVAEMSQAYREGILRREDRARAFSWLVPPIAIQHGLHRIARTDVAAQMAYQERIRGFHARLRNFYYPFLFDKRPFTPDDFARTPSFE